jgi:nascent polypeptide-associated complex subunit alpha
MIPGMGGMNPKKMQGIMKQMGISQEEVDAERVIIEGSESNIVIDNPQVSRVTMQGQETFQIVGEAREEGKEVKITEEDVKLVVEKTGKSEEEARKALEESGDLGEAIVKLSE